MSVRLPRRIPRLASVLSLLLAVGCTGIGNVPHASSTEVVLSEGNYRVVAADAKGSSFGVSLLGLVPLSRPSRIEALSALYEDAGYEIGSPSALANFAFEWSWVWYIVVSIRRVEVRADVIEFVR